MTVRRTAAALVVVPLFALASCSGDPHKPPPYTPSPTPTASTSPTPTGPVAPTLPAAAKKHTRAGAEAYVRYYVDVLNFASLNGQPAALARVTPEDCVGCQNILKAVRRVHNSGSVVTGGVWTVKSFGRGYPRAGAEYSFLTRVAQSPQVVTDAKGNQEKYEGGEVSYTFETAWSSGDYWRMTWLYYNG